MPPKSKRASSSNATGVWTAVIGAAAVIIAAAIPVYRWSAPSEKTLTFSGIVRGADQNGGDRAIADARVTVSVGQGSARVTSTHTSGDFSVELPAEARNATLTVEATGFKTETRDLDPHQTRPEEILLQPVVATQAQDKSGAITTGNITNSGGGTVAVGNGIKVGAKP
ncbi:MAG: carboxypeptidase regulatory-like domain-containing protein [Terracidiphilus sp.]